MPTNKNNQKIYKFFLIITILSLKINLYSFEIFLKKTINTKKAVLKVEVSNDNKYLAILDGGKELCLYNFDNFSLYWTFIEKKDGNVTIAFSPDNNYILIGCWDNSLKLIDVKNKQIVKKYWGHIRATRSIKFHPSGKIIASGGWDNVLRMWFIPTELNIKNLEITNQCIRSIDFSPNGNLIAVGGYDLFIRVWDLTNNRIKYNIKASNLPIEVVKFSPNGKYLASAGLENTIKIWDARDGTLIKILPGHTNSVYDIAFSPDNKFLVSCGADKTVKIWDLSNMQKIYSFTAHTLDIRTIAFSPDGKYLITGSYDRTVKIWDVSSLQIKPLIKKNPIKNILFHIPQIKLLHPLNTTFISHKRILTLKFEIDKPEYTLFQLFLNKSEYTRFYNNQKIIVKPTSIKRKENNILIIEYNVYLDYEKNFIQFIATNPKTQDIITSPEIHISYFDYEAFKDRTKLYVFYLNPNFKEKKLRKNFKDDNSINFIDNLKSLKNKLYNEVIIYDISNMNGTKLLQIIDSLNKQIKSYDVLVFYFNSFIIKNSNKIYFLTNQSKTNNFLNNSIPFDSIIYIANNTKGAKLFLINSSQRFKKKNKKIQLAEPAYLIDYFLDNIYTENRISFILFQESDLNKIQNISTTLINSLKIENDLDKNNLLDSEEFIKSLKNSFNVYYYISGFQILLNIKYGE